ncbi:MAG: hypothetical protein ACLR3E_01595 [Enterococcus durans]
MNEINVINNNSEILKQTADKLMSAVNLVEDVCEVLKSVENSQSRVALKLLNNLSKELLCYGSEIMTEVTQSENDDRAKYLDNLRGYFNEDIGTWYEQICRNFTKLTGFTANKWTALVWTLHLSLGISTREYFVQNGYIKKLADGQYVLPDDFDESTARKFGDNVELIRELEKNNFEALA